MKSKTRLERRKKRHFRIRTRLSGSADVPRLCVFRSNNNIEVQAIDDVAGHTIAAASSCQSALREQISGHRGNIVAAQVVGRVMADRLKEKGIEKAVFDRGGYLYHGRTKALADAIREGGIII